MCIEIHRNELSAEFLTAGHVDSGVPCTITRLNGKSTSPVEMENLAYEYGQHIDEKFNDFREGIKQFEAEIEQTLESGKSMGKTQMKELLHHMKCFRENAPANIRYAIHASSKFCQGKWKNITFKRSASGKWYVKICVETKEEQNKIQNGKAVGIDWNCNSDSFLTLSNGTKIKCPRFLKRKEKQLEKYQQIQSNRFVKGKNEQSHRYQKAKLKVARLHEKVANQRKDWLHKVSSALANKYQYVFVEDINLQKMSSELEHGKTVGDQGFGLLRQFLAYKTNLVKVPAEYTSKRCNTCGNINQSVMLGVKHWVCPVCNTKHDRDVNAAQNILYLGVKRTIGREPTDVLKNAQVTLGMPEAITDNSPCKPGESHTSLACG